MPGPPPEQIDEATRVLAEGERPGGNTAGQFAGLLVVAGHGQCGARIAQGEAPARGWLAAKVLQVAKTGEGAVAPNNAGRSKHHDGVADLLPPQPDQGIDVFRENAHRPGGDALHEESIAVGGLLRLLVTASHESSLHR